MEPRDYKAEGFGIEDCYEDIESRQYLNKSLVSDEEYRNLQAIAHIAKNVIMWYLVVAEGGRVNEIESLISSVQRWESEKD